MLNQVKQSSIFGFGSNPLGSITHGIHGAAIYGNIYHQYTPNVSIYTSTSANIFSSAGSYDISVLSMQLLINIYIVSPPSHKFVFKPHEYYSFLGITNHSYGYGSYLQQLSYRKRWAHIVYYIYMVKYVSITNHRLYRLYIDQSYMWWSYGYQSAYSSSVPGAIARLAWVAGVSGLGALHGPWTGMGRIGGQPVSWGSFISKVLVFWYVSCLDMIWYVLICFDHINYIIYQDIYQ